MSKLKAKYSVLPEHAFLCRILTHCFFTSLIFQKYNYIFLYFLYFISLRETPKYIRPWTFPVLLMRCHHKYIFNMVVGVYRTFYLHFSLCVFYSFLQYFICYKYQHWMAVLTFCLITFICVKTLTLSLGLVPTLNCSIWLWLVCNISTSQVGT